MIGKFWNFIFNFLSIGLTICSVQSCTTLTAEQCNQANWEDLGSKWAAKGESFKSGLEFYSVACQDSHGIELDRKNFENGFSKGLSIFCTADNLHTFALKGRSFPQSCLTQKNDKSIESFRSGRLKYLENKIEEFENKISYLEMENSSLRSENMGLKNQTQAVPFCPIVQ